MICKVVCLVALVGAVSAQSGSSGDSQLHNHKHYDYYIPKSNINVYDLSHPKYEYEYKVDDPHTHDHKIQHENRDGHHVENVYSVHTKHKHGDSYASVKRFVDHVVPVEIQYHHH